MNTAAPEKTMDRNKRRKLLPLFLLLLFMLMATSCIVGFLLGRTSDPERLGALIDTIVLAPETDPAGDRPAADFSERISIVGVVHYTNGIPFTQGSVKLHSEPRYAQLNETGHFRFDAVAPGEHELTVLDNAGNALASRTVRLERDAERDAYIDYEDMVCVMHVTVLTVEVDVELILGDTPGGELDVKLTGTREEDDPAAAAPGGTATPTPDDTPTTPPGDTSTPPPGDTPTQPPEEKPGEKPGDTPTQPTAPDPGSETDPDPGHDPTPTPPDTDPGTVEVSHSGDGRDWQSWIQQAEIDLFRPLDGSDRRIIAPGSKGHYLFRLQNGRSQTINFTLGLQEGNFHIPLEYRITTDEANPTGLTEWQTASVERETVSGTVQLEEGGDKPYRIEWRWPFEGNDGVDTALGSRDDRIYTLKLTIRVVDAV